MPQPVLPTLPSFPGLGSGEADRTSLLAGLTFIEGSTSGWGLPELTTWFKSYGHALGIKGLPPAVGHMSVGWIPLQPGAKVPGDRVARLEVLPKLLAMTRLKTIFTLRGLLGNPVDDRFLQAAIFSSRVQRHEGSWIARPPVTAFLSDMVTSLFVVDVLSHRDFYEQNLCICDVCGRLSFNPATTTRSGCGEHVPKTTTTSGVQGKGEGIRSDDD